MITIIVIVIVAVIIVPSWFEELREQVEAKG